MFATSGSKQAKSLKIKFEDHIGDLPSLKGKFFYWTTVAQVKKYLEKHTKTNSHNIRLFCKNIELNKNGQRLLDYGISNRQIITIRLTEELENSLGIVNSYQIYEKQPEAIDLMLSEVKAGFLNEIKPKLTEYGTCGTYFLLNHLRKTVAIFKPFDEQPYAPNNPRGYMGQLGSVGIRKGILSGESATREVAAYMLDDGFHGVPPTTYVEFYHPSFQEKSKCSQGPVPLRRLPSIPLVKQSKTKHGSLQSFMEHDDAVCNFSSSVFQTTEVHKIAILDLRILNCDRNQQNILVKKIIKTDGLGKQKKNYSLIPIDHGLSFPDNFQIYNHQVIWMEYSQAKQPFTEDQLNFIDRIDPIEDCKKLKQRLGFREICLRNFRIAETLLKRCAKAGLSLYQIGQIVYRSDDSDSQTENAMTERDHRLSQLEKLVFQAQNMYYFVKESGIKATVEYQLTHLNRNLRQIDILNKQNDDSDDQKPLRLKKKQSSFYQKQNKRSVSLPAIKKNTQRSKVGQALKRKSDITAKEEVWEQIFYHYFEEILERYLLELKLKSQAE